LEILFLNDFFYSGFNVVFYVYCMYQNYVRKLETHVLPYMVHTIPIAARREMRECEQRSQ
jgi:hypothetical protein